MVEQPVLLKRWFYQYFKNTGRLVRIIGYRVKDECYEYDEDLLALDILSFMGILNQVIQFYGDVNNESFQRHIDNIDADLRNQVIQMLKNDGVIFKYDDKKFEINEIPDIHTGYCFLRYIRNHLVHDFRSECGKNFENFRMECVRFHLYELLKLILNETKRGNVFHVSQENWEYDENKD